MFHRITTSKFSISKRFWLHRGELVAAKNSHRWPELAAQCDLDAFRSFTDEGKTVFTYADIVVGETIGENGRHRDSTLSPFMNSLRMVVAAYERSIQIGDQLRQGVTPICPPIMLSPLELKMLFAHPQYDALQADQEAAGIMVGLKLSGDPGELHSFYTRALTATV